MIVLPLILPRGNDVGTCSPVTRSGPGVVAAPFGWRPLYGRKDFHAGADFYKVAGGDVYSMITGRVCRAHFSHFGFEDAEQLDQFTLTAPSASLTAALGTSALTLTCARVGAVAFANVDRYTMAYRLRPKIADWTLEVNLSTAPSVVGAIGIGLFGPSSAERIGVEYDGTTVTLRAKSNGAAWAQDGATYPVAGATWLRVRYVQATDTYSWQHSTDGIIWTTLDSVATKLWLEVNATLEPSLYWRSGDTSATPYTLSVLEFNLADEDQSVGRFGNWLRISNESGVGTLAHFRTLLVPLGSCVSAGQLIGRVGSTGFNDEARVFAEHAHDEWTTVPGFNYARANQINPLGVGVLPRANVSNNVSVVRSTANDPNGVSSHLFTITVARADQDFDLNSVLITLSGAVTRSFNFNTRAGLDPANVDNPAYNNCYFEPQPFNEDSTEYVLKYYVDAALGAFVSGEARDTAGTLLWSEP